MTEEKKPATSEPGTSGGNSTSNAPMVAMAAVAPTSREVKLSDGDGSKQTTKRPAEVSATVNDDVVVVAHVDNDDNTTYINI